MFHGFNMFDDLFEGGVYERTVSLCVEMSRHCMLAGSRGTRDTADIHGSSM